jgi:D-alanyl-D-alanine carboxypeptidase
MKGLILAVSMALSAGTVGPASAAAPTTADFVTSYAKAHDFSGGVLIEAGGQIVYEHSFGFANLQFHVPATTRTRYRIASITKAFTAVLVLRQYEQGRLDLDKTIKDYLPDYAGEAGGVVTVRELLHHTSGLYNMDQVKSAADALQNGLPPYQSPFTSDQLMAKFASGKLVNPPGKVFDYNNGDYVILGKLVERLYGKPYDVVLQEQILSPLHLDDTGMARQADIVDGLADTYFYRDDLKRLAPDLPAYPENWYAAGAIYSSARDVLGFSDALFGLKLLKAKTLDVMLAPGLDDYACGVWVYDLPVNGRNYRVMKRPGQIMGAQSQLYHFIGTDITIVILSNTSSTDLDQFVKDIGDRLVG